MRKNRVMKLSLLALTILFGAISTTSAEEANGGYAASFLQVPIGARPTAMGGAYLAISNDAAGALFNPAGLNTLERPLFGTSYRAMKLDRKLGYATVIFPVRGRAALGIHWLYAGSGSVKVRNSDGYLDATGREFSQNSHLFGVLFAKRFSDLIAVGTKMNYLHVTIPEVTAYSVAFDFGTTFYLSELINREKRDLFPIQDIQAAIVLKSVSAVLPWNNEKYARKYTGADALTYEQDDNVPAEWGFGISGRILKKKLILANDIRKNSKQSMRLFSGAEYIVKPELALRAGFGDTRFSAGVGFLFKLSGKKLAVDYAFSTDKADEGSEHIFSIDMLF